MWNAKVNLDAFVHQAVQRFEGGTHAFCKSSAIGTFLMYVVLEQSVANSVYRFNQTQLTKKENEMRNDRLCEATYEMAYFFFVRLSLSNVYPVSMTSCVLPVSWSRFSSSVTNSLHTKNN